jgi:hypothetical protein
MTIKHDKVLPAHPLKIRETRPNRRFPLKLVVIHEDGEELASAHAQVEAGRPPGLPAGSDIRSVIAVNAEAQFKRLGTYEFRAELDGKVRSTRSGSELLCRCRLACRYRWRPDAHQSAPLASPGSCTLIARWPLRSLWHDQGPGSGIP